MLIIEALYVLAAFLLAAYGLHHIYLLSHFLCTRRQRFPQPDAPADWPRVTVQLPVYDEVYTVERVMRAVAGLDYPRERLEVQVLDDSTDATSAVVARTAADLRRMGISVSHRRRRERAGYKAGALAAGLRQAGGSLLAIFDADFVPTADFLRRAVPYFSDPNVGCVQARWAHLNRNYSRLTRAQALGVDGHFVVEQAARASSGLFLNFNGTAGIWRRAAIESAGGWQCDTLTEDLDLSYRAQLAGWRIAYLTSLPVPAELPVQMDAFKRQQARWAKGSIQTARKLMRPLLASSQPARIKLAGLLHLTGYLVHPLMLAVVLAALPLALAHSRALQVVPYLMVAALGPPALYLAAGTPGGPGWRERLRLLPWLLILGIGLSLNNTGAVLEGLFGRDSGQFARTPKFALGGSAGAVDWRASRYAILTRGGGWGEALLAALALAGLVVIAGLGGWGVVPWLALYACGHAYVAAVSLRQGVQLRWEGFAPQRSGVELARRDYPRARRDPAKNNAFR